MKLKKLWSWNDNAATYYDFKDVEHTDYPFYYYMVFANNEIHYIKQISKYCSGVMDINWYVADPEAVIEPQKEIQKEIENYSERKSWTTFGPVIADPVEEYTEIIDGNKRVVSRYNFDGLLNYRGDYVNDILVYCVKIQHKIYKGHSFPVGYENSQGKKADLFHGRWVYNK